MSLPTLRDGTLVSVLAACGIPPGLVQTTAGGASAVRESWRQFAHGSLGALARIFEVELSEKLGTPIIDSVWATGRCRYRRTWPHRRDSG